MSVMIPQRMAGTANKQTKKTQKCGTNYRQTLRLVSMFHSFIATPRSVLLAKRPDLSHPSLPGQPDNWTHTVGDDGRNMKQGGPTILR